MERRSLYRVDSPDGEDLHVAICTPDGRILSGRITDLSMKGCGVRVDRRFAVTWPTAVGRRVELLFSSARLQEDLTVPSEIIHLLVEGDAVRYGLVFTDPTGLESRLVPGLRAVFNRRSTPRISCRSAAARIGLADRPRGMEVDAKAIDLSTGGVCVEVDSVAESALVVEDRVTVSIEVPGRGLQGPLRGTIRSRNAGDTAIRFGIKFAAMGSNDAAVSQTALIGEILSTL